MVNPIYPTRSFIRFQAKSQLTADMIGQQVMAFVNRGSNERAMDMAIPHVSSKDIPNQDIATENEDLDQTSADVREESDSLELDEGLLNDIAKLVFHPDQHPEIYQPCTSREHAAEIERAIATEIVDTYRQIKANETRPRIKALNALL